MSVSPHWVRDDLGFYAERRVENWTAACVQNLFADCDFSGCVEKWSLCGIATFLIVSGHVSECVPNLFVTCVILRCVETWALCGMCPQFVCTLRHIGLRRELHTLRTVSKIHLSIATCSVVSRMGTLRKVSKINLPIGTFWFVSRIGDTLGNASDLNLPVAT